MPLTRRRFITISASAALIAGPAMATPLFKWQGSALGARASIILQHPDAKRITKAVRAEIDRLEDIFSLYRAGSAISRLNATGQLDAPPFELLECLSLAAHAHQATEGLFDPTIQPLWALYAEANPKGQAPDQAQITARRALGGWGDVRYDPSTIRLRPGMALTLNGIAQGYIADRVAALLRMEGLNNVLIDTGELRALGGHPQGGDWPVTLDQPDRPVIGLYDRALASSAPLGTVFDAAGTNAGTTAGTQGHILDPRTGRPATLRWQLISISAGSATMADALSTACCLMEPDQIGTAISRIPSAKLEHLSPHAARQG